MFIVGGAFSGLDKIINQRKNDSGIGFSAKVKNIKPDKTFSQTMDSVGLGSYKIWFNPEFVGRLPVTATLDELDEKSQEFSQNQKMPLLTNTKNYLIWRM